MGAGLRDQVASDGADLDERLDRHGLVRCVELKHVLHIACHAAALCGGCVLDKNMLYIPCSFSQWC